LKLKNNAKETFPNEVKYLNENPYLEELYLRIYFEVPIETVFDTLIHKFPNIKIFKFWTMPREEKTEKYISQMFELWPKLEELQLKNYSWSRVEILESNIK